MTKRVIKDELYKDRSHLRDNDSAYKQHRATRAPIKDFSLKHRVWVEWDMNQDSMDDRMVVLNVDDYKVVLDTEEIMRAVRFV